MADLDSVKALTFDVFGTVVDWRSSITREGETLGRAKGLTADWARFADAWRGLYQPNLSRVRSGELPWTKLDELHRMSLDRLLVDFGIAGLSETEIDHLNRAWHRLDPWPDAVPGLERLRRRFILATCSNGNVALMVNMAKRAGLPWDAILGAETARHYKPQPEAYLITADMLGVKAVLRNREGIFLLIRRSPEKYPEVGPRWDIVGGRIEPGTPLLENLKREIKEETNLDLADEPKLIAAQDILRIPGRHVVRLTYLAAASGTPKLDADHTEYRWFTLEEMKRLEPLDIYFKELLLKNLVR